MTPDYELQEHNALILEAEQERTNQIIQDEMRITRMRKDMGVYED